MSSPPAGHGLLDCQPIRAGGREPTSKGPRATELKLALPNRRAP